MVAVGRNLNYALELLAHLDIDKRWQGSRDVEISAFPKATGVRIALLSNLLTNRGKNHRAAKSNLQHSLRYGAFLVPDLNAIQTLNAHLLHLIGDRSCTVSGEAVHTGAYQKMRAHLLCGTEKFVNGLSRSPMWMQRWGSFNKAVDCLRFSNQRMLSFCPMGTRVGLIFFFKSLQP
jgi:hypothetical protein